MAINDLPHRLNQMGLAILLLAPLATALSRNIAFVGLVLAVFFLVAGVLVAQASRGPAQPTRWAHIAAISRSHMWVLTIAILLALVGALSLLWSPNAARGLSALLQVIAACLLTALGFHCLKCSKPVPWLPVLFLLAIAATCALVLFELSNGSPIRMALGGTAETFRLNRAAVSVTIAAPLVLLTVHAHWAWYIIAFALIALIGQTAFTSISESAQLAFLVVLVLLALSRLIKVRLLLLACCSAVALSHVLAPVIGWAILEYVPREAFEAIGYPSQYWRAIIWGAYASEVSNAPLWGHGLQASYTAGEAYLGSDPTIRSGFDFVHPHNLSLQVWYELGLSGIALSTALFILLVRPLFALPDRHKLVAASLLAATWTVMFVSHGAWQHWWWSLCGIMMLLFVALTRPTSASRVLDGTNDFDPAV